MKKFLRKIIPQFIINYYHFSQALAANFIYGFPSRKLKVVGVTGTNGKTTVVELIARILKEAGFKVASFSTIYFQIDEQKKVNQTKMTTLSSFELQKFIKQAKEEGCQWLVLETTSHALDQHRTRGINYLAAVFTNLTREHLDYHKTMEKYRKAKTKLFKKADIHIVNLDDLSAQYFLKLKAKEKWGYGIENTGQETESKNLEVVRAEKVKAGPTGASFDVRNLSFNLKLPAKFNVYNSLAAICFALSQKIDLKTAKKALEKVEGIDGRMEWIDGGQPFKILVDYAVTPDSLKKLYQEVKKINPRKIIAVFGSCGERDKGKRPIMGEIVGQQADLIIVTNEDPYGEDPQAIIDQVFAGVKKAGKVEDKNCWRILDRRLAISKALSLARANDIVVVTGKGAETSMAIGDKRIDWDDRQVIREELGKI